MEKVRVFYFIKMSNIPTFTLIFLRIVAWLLFVASISYIIASSIAPIALTSSFDNNTGVVNAATLYQLIDRNTVIEEEKEDKNYYFHLVYDFDNNLIKLLKITKDEIRCVATYERPRGKYHVVFVKSWRELKNTCDSSLTNNVWPPPLTDLIEILDRDRLRLALMDIPLKQNDTLKKSLHVSVSDNSQEVVYRDSFDNQLRLQLPSHLRAKIIYDDDNNMDSSSSPRVTLNVVSPCSQSDKVTYADFERYYVARFSAVPPQSLLDPTIGNGETVISRFRWLCKSIDDLEPTLVPVD